MDNPQHKKILYIGPYNEESNSGRTALSNINGLKKIGHELKIIPIYNVSEKYRSTPKDLVPLELNNLEDYDICIQHCEPMQYSFSGNIPKNIGIYHVKSSNPDPIINTRLALLDHIVVYSKTAYNILSKILSRNISKNMVYCPTHVDLQHISQYPHDAMEWADHNKYYFYTELEFTDEYDWEKLIAVYVTTFKNKNAELIIKTTKISDESEAAIINSKIHDIVTSANINPNTNFPKVLKGIFDEDVTMKIYNTIDCFIDCGRTQDYNRNIFIAAAMNKDIICNSKLAASEFFNNAYRVDAHPCNINHKNDAISSIYDLFYTMDSNSIREQMLWVYENRHSVKTTPTQDLQQYDISNINGILC